MDDKYTELAVKLQDVDTRCKTNEHKIDDLNEQMNKFQETQITLVKLADGVDKMANQLVDMKEDIKYVKTSQNDLSDKVTALENRPAQETKKRWDTISEKILWLFIAGVTGFLFAQLLPGIF